MSLTQTGNNDGTIDWDFSLDNSLVQYLADGESVSVVYTITVDDGSGLANATESQTVSIDINGTNDQPTITIVDAIGAVTEDNSNPNLSDSGSVTFDEVDETDVLNSSVAKASESTTSTASIPADLTTALDSAVTLNQSGTNDGTIDWNFELDNSLVQYLAAGETVTAVYAITVKDDSGTATDTTMENVTVTITGANDRPSISVVDVAGAVTEDASTPNLTDSGSITFAEVDDTDVLTSSVAKSGEATSSSASIPSGLSNALSSAVTLTQTGDNDGTIDWDFSLDNSLVQYLAVGETVTVDYTITVDDNSGTSNATEAQGVTVVISGTNDQPSITVVDVTGSVTEDASTPSLTDSGSVSFSEVDETDVLTSSVAKTSESTTSAALIPAALSTALSSAVTLNQTGTNDGTIDWDFELDNSLVQYLADGESVSAVYTITVDDNTATANATTTEDVTITIHGTNDQPVISGSDTSSALTETGAQLIDTGTLNVVDIDVTDQVTASVDSVSVGSASSFAGTNPLSNAQMLAMMAVSPTTALGADAAAGSDFDWTFTSGTSGDEAFDFLSSGETLVLDYVLKATDDSGATTGESTMDTQVVTVTITGANNAPVIGTSDLIGETTEDETSPFLTDQGVVEFTDLDLADVHVASASFTGSTHSSQLGNLTASITTDTTGIGTGGELTWNFSVSNNLVQFLGDSESLTETYSITLDDQNGGVLTRSVTVTVFGENDNPVIVSLEDEGDVTEDDSSPTLTDSDLVNFQDVDSTDSHTTTTEFKSTTHSTQLGSLSTVITTQTLPSGLFGVATWDFEVDNADVQFLGVGETIVEKYDVIILDDSGTDNNWGRRQVDITITGINDQPIITPVDVVGAVTEDGASTTLTDSGAVDFTEIDDNDVLTSSIAKTGETTSSAASIPTALSTALDSAATMVQTGTNDGTIDWDFALDNNLVQYLAEGETITVTYTITVDDNTGESNATQTQEVTVTITGTNDQPTITVTDVEGAVTEDASTPNLTDSGSISFAEVDETDTITSSVAKTSESTSSTASIPVDLTSALDSAVTLNQSGTNDGTIDWDFELDNSLVQYLADGETVTAIYTLTIDDGSGTANSSETQEITITITGTNDQPTIAPIDVTGEVFEDGRPIRDRSSVPVREVLPTAGISVADLTDSGFIAFNEVDETDVLTSSVAKTNETTNSTAAIPAALSSALSSAVTLNQSGTNDGTIDWTFTLSNDLVQYLADGETVTATYTITVDDNSGTASATETQDVTIVINGNNDQPIINIVDVVGSVNEDDASTLTDSGAVSFTEVDETDVITASAFLTAVAPSAGASSTTALTTALGSALTISQTGTNDGTIDWTFSLDNSLVQYLGEGESVSGIYLILVQDDSGQFSDTAVETVTVTINGTNDQPTITVGDNRGDVTEDSDTPNLTDSGSVTFQEVDDTDQISSGVVKSSESTSSTAAIPTALSTALDMAVSLTQTGNNDGTIDWDFSLDNELVQYLGEGETVTAIYTITVSDDSGAANASATEDVTVTITGTNDQPTITVVDIEGAVTEDALTPNLTDSGSVSFNEVDETDVLTSSVSKTSEATTSSASIPSALTTALDSAVTLTQTGTNDGTIDWDFSLDNSLVQYLADGETVTALYTLTVDDNSGTANATDSQTLTITITGTNDQPTISITDVEGAVTEDTSTPNLTDSGSVDFAEVDETDVLTSSVAKTGESTTSLVPVPGLLSTALDSAVTLTQTGSNDGTIDWDFSIDNSLVEYLANGETVTATYTVTVKDDSGQTNDTATEQVTVTITGTNDQPTIAVVDVDGAVSEDDSTPNLIDGGLVSFAEVDESDVLTSSIAKTNESTTSLAAIPAALSTALDSAISLTQVDTNDGTIDWDFSLDNSLVQYLADSETVTAEYTLTVDDQSGTANATETQLITIVITGRNDQPEISVTDVTGQVTEDASTPNLTDSGAVSFTEVDETDVLTSSVAKTGDFTTSVSPIPSDLAAALGSAMTLTQTGSNDGTIDWDFSLDNSLVQYLAAGELVMVTYTITVTDDSGAANNAETQEVTIEIYGTNDQPIITVGDVEGAVVEDDASTLTEMGSITFMDIDDADVLTSIVDKTSESTSSAAAIPSALSSALDNAVSLVQTGSNDGTIDWNFTLDNALVQYLAQSETVTAIYTITVSDDTSMSTQDVTLTITGTNDLPEISIQSGDTDAVTVTETNAGLTATGTLSLEDVDVTNEVNVTSPFVTVIGDDGGAGTTGIMNVLNNPVLSATATNGLIHWSFDSGSEAFNHISQGDTLVLAYNLEAVDSEGAVDNGTVTITINGTNDVPVSQDVTASATEDGATVSGSFVADDVDTDDTPATLVYTVTSSPSEGSVSNNNDGTFTFDPGTDFQDLSVGETRDVTFTYTATDQHSAISTASTVTVTVTGVNDDPEFSVNTGDSDSELLTETDAGLSISATVSLSDVDVTDEVSVSIEGVSVTGDDDGLGTAALLSMFSTGANPAIDNVSTNEIVDWTFDSGSEAFDHLATGEQLELVYTLRATDSQAAVSDHLITVTIDGTNDAPDITVGGSDSANEVLTETDAGLSVTKSLSVSDLDTTDTVDASVASVLVTGDDDGLSNSALLSMLTLGPNPVVDGVSTTGTIPWTFDSGSEAFDHLAVGESLILAYVVEATDSQATDQQTVSITINGTNDEPEITVGSSDSAAETLTETDNGLTVSKTLSVEDLDTTNTVDASVESVAVTGNMSALTNAGLLGMLSVGVNPVVSSGATTGTINWTFDSGSEAFDHLSAGETLVLDYTVRATDSSASIDDQIVSITIAGSNDDPAITVGASGSDSESLTETNAGLAVTKTLDVSDLDETDTVDASVQSVVVTGDDDGLDMSTLLGMMSVGANPVIASGVTSGTIQWTFDSGSEAFDHLAVGESLTLEYTLVATDSQAAMDDHQVTITIQGTNDSPTISIEAADSAAESLTETDSGLNVSRTLTVTDLDTTDIVDGSIVSVATVGNDGGIDNATLLGMFSLGTNPVIDGASTSDTLNWAFDSGSEAFDHLSQGETLQLLYTVRATDSQTATADQTVTVTITGTNDDPIAQDVSESAVEDGSTVISTFDADDIDSEDTSSTLIYTIMSAPSEGTVSNNNDGTFTFDPGSDFQDLALGEFRDVTFTYTATDTQSAISNTATATITVAGMNDDPVISVQAADSDMETLTETDAGLNVSKTLSVEDVDTSDTVDGSVLSVLSVGDTGGLSNTDLLNMFSLSANPIIDGASTSASMTWTFDSGSESFDHLGEGESLTITYMVQVQDSQTATDTHTVTVLVEGTNDAPAVSVTAIDSDAETLTETDAGLTVSKTLSVEDLDVTDTVDASVESVVVTGDADGVDQATLLAMMSVATNPIVDGTSTTGTATWSFDSGSEAFDHLAQSETLELAYTIRVTDSESATDDQVVTITINGSNDDPTISIGAEDSASESLDETNSGLSTTQTLSLEDLDTTNTVDVVTTGVAATGDDGGLSNAALLGMLTLGTNPVIDAAGTTGTINWTFDSGSEAFDHLAVGESLLLEYTLEATDSQSATDTQVVSVTINGTQDAPVISVEAGDSDAETLTETDSGLTSIGSLSVADLDLTDTVNVTVESVSVSGDDNGLGTAALQGMLSLAANPVIDGSATIGKIDWSFDSGSEAFDHLADGESLELTYTVRATDSQTDSDDHTVTITINGTNEDPTITVEAGDSDAQTLSEIDSGLSVGGTLSVEDLDVTDTTDASVESFTVVSGDDGGLGASLAGMMSVGTNPVIDAVSTSGKIAWTFDSGSEAFDYLAVGESLVVAYELKATDSEGASDTHNVTITIEGTNEVPVISVEAADSDAESLTESGSGLSTSQTLTVSDLDVTDTVDASVVSVAVTGDDDGIGNAALLSMMTAGVNPVVSTTTDNGVINWTFDSGSEAFEHLSNGDALVLEYTIRATDSQLASSDQVVTVTINGTTTAPVISVGAGDSDSETLAETDAGLATSQTLTVDDIDRSDTVNASVVVSVFVTGDAGGISNVDLLSMMSTGPNPVIDSANQTGKIDWTFDSGSQTFDYLAKDENLQLVYTIRANDSHSESDDHNVTITITGTNDAPAISAQAGDSDTETLAETNIPLTATETLTVTDLDTTDTVDAVVDSVVVTGDDGGLSNATLLGMLDLGTNPVLDAVTSTGKITWTFNSSPETFDHLDFGDTLALAYTIRVNDPEGGTDTATISITIDGSNDVLFVTNTDDSGPGSLRNAIETANAEVGPDQIKFDLPNTSTQLIQPLTQLPSVTDSVLIDGTTDGTCGTGFAPHIQIDGGGTIVDGLVVGGTGSTIKGLSITGFADSGIELVGGGEHLITCNFVGIDPVGNAAGNSNGVRTQNSSNNQIHRNVISGNNRSGVFLNGAASNANVLTENLIGTDPTGTSEVPNLTDGITARGPNTMVGLPGQGNVISGNERWGFFTTSFGSGSVIQDNLIGTDITGQSALGNTIGVYLRTASNIVGNAEYGNVISGNVAYGLAMAGVTATNNLVQGNTIGTDAEATVAIPNGLFGVRLTQSGTNTIGGTGSDEGNTISGNGGAGVLLTIARTDGNQVVGNRIGVGANDIPIPNDGDGVRLSNRASSNTIQENVISGNLGRAISMSGAGTLNNDIVFNMIGTNTAGDQPIHNGVGGALRLTAPSTRIEGNVISSVDHGLLAFGNAVDLEIVDNYFGTDVNEQSTSLGMNTGITIVGTSGDNLIDGNTIANNQKGIVLINSTGNEISENRIYNNSSIGIDLGNNGADTNDIVDSDSGANNHQNFPEISQASLVGTTLTLTYRVDSSATSSAYAMFVEFFVSDGNGQGKEFIGFNDYLQPERRKLKTITFENVNVNVGDKIVATATDAAGNTSEFGLEFEVVEGELSE